MSASSRPWLAAGFSVLLIALTITLFFQAGPSFFPAADEGDFVVDYLTPAGSALSEMGRRVRVPET